MDVGAKPVVLEPVAQRFRYDAPDPEEVAPLVTETNGGFSHFVRGCGANIATLWISPLQEHSLEKLHNSGDFFGGALKSGCFTENRACI